MPATPPELSAAREAVLQRAANMLMDARRNREPITALPADVAPATEQESFYIQDVIGAAHAPIGGWKVGARGPEGEPFFAPMPAAWMGEDGSLFSGMNHRLHGVEAELAFRMGHDLPARALPYTREEVIAAIATLHPAIEILESAYVDPEKVSREDLLADLQINGGFVAGPAVPQWHDFDFANEKATLLVDGSVRVERIGSNPGGNDPVRLLVYLANEGAARTGGLKHGDWITTGSWTGVTWAAYGSEVIAHFQHAGRASLRFAAEKA